MANRIKNGIGESKYAEPVAVGSARIHGEPGKVPPQAGNNFQPTTSRERLLTWYSDSSSSLTSAISIKGSIKGQHAPGKLYIRAATKSKTYPRHQQTWAARQATRESLTGCTLWQTLDTCKRSRETLE